MEYQVGKEYRIVKPHDFGGLDDLLSDGYVYTHSGELRFTVKEVDSSGEAAALSGDVIALTSELEEGVVELVENSSSGKQKMLDEYIINHVESGKYKKLLQSVIDTYANLDKDTDELSKEQTKVIWDIIDALGE